MTIKKVLIAHQSTIPHYRIPFYNTLERLRPNTWEFKVVFDKSELSDPTIYQENINEKEMLFPIHEVETVKFPLKDDSFFYQTFFWKARKFDLIIVENAVHNLTYPLSHIHQISGKKIIYWGHGKDRNIKKPSKIKAFSEFIKIELVKRADGFFAYTQGVLDFLVGKGITDEKIFVLNNTIDIIAQRSAYEKARSTRDAIKNQFGLNNKKVLLYVGRFTENKKIDFLLKAIDFLRLIDNNYHLLIVGTGRKQYIEKIENMANLTYFGPLISLDELAPIYVASDVFVFPGSVGLGPLQALCYDLPVFAMESQYHMPEIEYLSEQNSVILPKNTSEEQYARAIYNMAEKPGELENIRLGIWSSIQHLTIENMARNFIFGINTILDS